ncbi:hypothetical protein ACERII_16750 [Evansella sp. AB-rgal1]
MNKRFETCKCFDGKVEEEKHEQYDGYRESIHSNRFNGKVQEDIILEKK